MAKFTIRVDRKTGMTYFPKEIREEGFVGQIEGLPNALTFTLIKPGTKLSDVQRSLQIVVQDIALCIEQGLQIRRLTGFLSDISAVPKISPHVSRLGIQFGQAYLSSNITILD